MKIGDKVRFLNDVGGGIITGFRQGGIVLVEDADGFDIPMPQHEVVVIEEEKEERKMPKVEKKAAPGVEKSEKERYEAKKPEVQSLNGKEYLKSKTVQKEEDEGIDEQLEARIVRLEMVAQDCKALVQKMKAEHEQYEALFKKQEARIALLEAKFNLQQNEKAMARRVKQTVPKPQPPANIGELDIL